MTKCKYVVLSLLTLMIILSSCSKKDQSTDIYTRIYEKYNNITSYQCEMTMNISSNKTVNQYKLKQFYKEPDDYAVEMLEPEELKGLITVYNAGDVVTIHPKINGKFTLLNFNPVGESYMFIPDFFQAYYKSENTSVKVSNAKGSKHTVLKADIPGGNIHRFSQAIWIDNESLLPIKMEIYDMDQKPTISIKYTDIKFDIEIGDQIFQID